MPELPEIEAMRQRLLPLISKTRRLKLHSDSKKPPRKFLTPEQMSSLDGNCLVTDVLRKGKCLCMVLECDQKVQGQKTVYMSIHMGMTGRLSSKGYIQKLKSLKESEEYPPSHTHLILSLEKRNNAKEEEEVEVCFSDPRKFGSVELSLTLEGVFGTLAVDAMLIADKKYKDTAIASLSEQSTSIKGVLLDQRRVSSGVGNWIADEVLYQCQLHPDQKFLTVEESTELVDKLSYILKTAVQCLNEDKSFPDDWIFHRRWATKRDGIKDAKGRAISFVTSAGRGSAIVLSIQKKRARSKNRQKKNSTKEVVVKEEKAKAAATTPEATRPKRASRKRKSPSV
mgnify:CR=1 FL=1